MSRPQAVILLRGCHRCRLVFWFYQDEKELDCRECGRETNNIEWSPVPGFAVDAPKVFLMDEPSEA